MAFRTWVRTLLAALGVAALAGASQLGVAYGLGVLRLTRDFDAAGRDQWNAQLAWVAWFAIVAAVIGALAGGHLHQRRARPASFPPAVDRAPVDRTPGDPAPASPASGDPAPGDPALGDPAQASARALGVAQAQPQAPIPVQAGPWTAVTLAIAAGIGAAVVIPLTMQPARTAQVAAVSPALVIGICAALGAVVGILAGYAALTHVVARWSLATMICSVWALAIGSVLPSLGPHDMLPAVRLGVFDAGFLAPATTQRFALFTMPALALVVGAGLGWLARRRDFAPLTIALAGLPGPALVTIAYLIAGPGEGDQRYQVVPYWAAMVAAGTGVLGATIAALIRRADEKHPSDDPEPGATHTTPPVEAKPPLQHPTTGRLDPVSPAGLPPVPPPAPSLPPVGRQLPPLPTGLTVPPPTGPIAPPPIGPSTTPAGPSTTPAGPNTAGPNTAGPNTAGPADAHLPSPDSAPARSTRSLREVLGRGLAGLRRPSTESGTASSGTAGSAGSVSATDSITTASNGSVPADRAPSNYPWPNPRSAGAPKPGDPLPDLPTSYRGPAPIPVPLPALPSFPAAAEQPGLATGLGRGSAAPRGARRAQGPHAPGRNPIRQDIPGAAGSGPPAAGPVRAVAPHVPLPRQISPPIPQPTPTSPPPQAPQHLLPPTPAPAPRSPAAQTPAAQTPARRTPAPRTPAPRSPGPVAPAMLAPTRPAPAPPAPAIKPPLPPTPPHPGRAERAEPTEDVPRGGLPGRRSVWTANARPLREQDVEFVDWVNGLGND